MAEQLSTLSRERFRESIQNQREQATPQSPEQLRIEISGQQNELSLLSEVLSQRNPVISQAVIGNVLIDGVRELLVPSFSSFQQSYLQQILQEAQQYTQTSQQRHAEGNNQFIIQLPVQTNQQLHQEPIRMFQQSHAEQSLLQIPLPLQMLHLRNPGNTNTQMLLQLSQLLANSNLPSRESSVASQESHMRTMESLPQASQQENPQSSHFCVELPQQTNQYSQQQQSLDSSQQQHVHGTQQLLLQISQQIPVFSLQQPIQQVQPLLVRVFQQSSQQPCSEENRDSLLQVPQQSVQSIQQPIAQPVQQIPIQSLQQMLSTQQVPMQSSQQPPILPIQQPNQARPSIFKQSLQSRETAQAMQQLQSNQPSTSSEQSISQRIQQILQMSQHPISESRRTDSGSTSCPLAQMHQQQSNQQMLQQPQNQTIQESSLAQFFPWESMGVPVGILQISGSESQTSQETSQTIHGSLEIPQISLFELPPQQFMRIIQQCPYNRPSCQESSLQSARGSPQKSCHLQSHQDSFTQLPQESPVQSHQRSSTPVCQRSGIPPSQKLSVQLAQESLLQSDQGKPEQSRHESSTSLPRESRTGSSRRHSLSLTNQIQELPPQTATPAPIFNTNELQRTFTEDNHNNEGIGAKERNGRSILEAQNNSLSTALETTATEYEGMKQLEIAISETSIPENSESQVIADNVSDSTVTANENTTGIMAYVNSHHISNLNDNSSVPFNNDCLASLILTSLATLTSALSNQQTQSDIPRNDITSLLLNNILNLTETNYHMDSNRNGDMAMQFRNELYRILVEDETTTQELRRRLANLSARIESLSYLINNVMTSKS